MKTSSRRSSLLSMLLLDPLPRTQSPKPPPRECSRQLQSQSEVSSLRDLWRKRASREPWIVSSVIENKLLPRKDSFPIPDSLTHRIRFPSAGSTVASPRWPAHDVVLPPAAVSAVSEGSPGGDGKGRTHRRFEFIHSLALLQGSTESCDMPVHCTCPKDSVPVLTLLIAAADQHQVRPCTRYLPCSTRSTNNGLLGGLEEQDEVGMCGNNGGR